MSVAFRRSVMQRDRWAGLMETALALMAVTGRAENKRRRSLPALRKKLWA